MPFFLIISFTYQNNNNNNYKNLNLLVNYTCTSTSCFRTEFIRTEKRDRSTPFVSKVASANRIAADMIPSKIAKSFSSCCLRMHRQQNSAKGTTVCCKDYNAKPAIKLFIPDNKLIPKF